MERPFVVCHMLASLDGKIDGAFFGAQQTAPALSRYTVNCAGFTAARPPCTARPPCWAAMPTGRNLLLAESREVLRIYGKEVIDYGICNIE